jgi:hypothetical protein
MSYEIRQVAGRSPLAPLMEQSFRRSGPVAITTTRPS